MIMDNQKEQHDYDNIFNDGNDSDHQDRSEQIKYFPADYKPGEWDVICQRGRENYDHG
jgi:hypothetical protein